MVGKNEVPYAEEIPDEAVSLSDARVIGDVIDSVAGSASVTVKYGGQEVKNGVRLTAAQTAEPPTIQIAGSKTYTVVMVDPDAPSPSHPKHRCWLHWILANIPAKDPQRGEEIEAYMGPDPPQGKHRYVFLFFEQTSRVAAKSPASRANFQAKQWARDHGLSETPAGAAFFVCEAE